jgi:hypothetical protein
MDHSLSSGVKVYTNSCNEESHVYTTGNCSSNLLKESAPLLLTWLTVPVFAGKYFGYCIWIVSYYITKNLHIKVKQYLYRPGQVLRVPGS